MDNILSEVEKGSLESFYKNETMREAVRKVLLAGIYYNGTLAKGETATPTKNAALALAWDSSMSDAEVGADLRAFAKAIMIVEQAFQEIRKYENKLPKKPEPNPAR